MAKKRDPGPILTDNQYKGYVYVRDSVPRHCKDPSCEGVLITTHIRYKSRFKTSGEIQSTVVKQCNKCKKYHIDYFIYEKNPNMIDCINEDDLPQLGKQAISIKNRIIGMSSDFQYDCSSHSIITKKKDKRKAKAEIKNSKEDKRKIEEDKRKKEEAYQRAKQRFNFKNQQYLRELEEKKHQEYLDQKEKERTYKESQKTNRIKEREIARKRSTENSMTALMKAASRERYHYNDNNIDSKDFVIRRSTLKCFHEGHILRDLMANAKIMNRSGIIREISFPAGYCATCNVFFIMNDIFKRIQNRGILLCRLSDERKYIYNPDNINAMNLAGSSILMEYGYNVNAKKNLSITERRCILAFLMDEGILTRSDILSYLNFFISQRRSNYAMENAINKWNEDKNFVIIYNIGNYLKYGVKGLYARD